MTPQTASFNGTSYSWYQVDWHDGNPLGWTADVALGLAFGQPVGSFNGVTAYSNGYPVPNYTSNDYNDETGINTGMKWQCVEYVNRYYHTTYGINIRIAGTNANQYYGTAASRGLIAYANGGTVAPQVGDILCFSGNSDGTGHVAIIRAVSGTSVTAIQQNWTEDRQDANYTFAMTVSGGTYSVSGLGSLSVQGWLRKSQLPIGDAVQATGAWNIRSTPGGSFAIGTTAAGQTGIVLDGPLGQIYDNVYYNWYKVSWDGGLTGWTVENGLQPTTNAGSTNYQHDECWLKQDSGYAVSFAGTNPSLADLQAQIRVLSAQYQVPVEIIGAVAYQESGLHQYGEDGFVVHNKTECRSDFNSDPNSPRPPGLGLMQLTGSTAAQFDLGRLITDWRYNLEAGVKVLADKYEASVKNDPAWMLPLDRANRNVLENWYYALKGYNGWGPVSGYELRVDVARGGTQLESDANYSNDSISGANVLTLGHGIPGHSVATVAGTSMSPEWGNTDKDTYLLGTLSAGNEVTLNVRLPFSSSWNGMVTVVDASGSPVTDKDGVADGHFQGTIPADGAYYAKVLPVWNYNGHAYVLTDSSRTWTDAEAYALGLGGHLATINDAAENEWIRTTFSSAFGSLWIGLTDQPVEGTWVWSSGQAVTYMNWSSGQPNNYDDWWGGGDADGAMLQTDGTWNDLRVNAGSLPGLIELNGAWTGGSGTGPSAQYLLDLDVLDPIPPQVLSVSPLPVAGGSTPAVVDKLVVTTSKDLDAATVNVNNRMVWQYNGHFYVITDSSQTWADAEAQAVALGGHLATVNDASEQDWLHRTFERFGSVWIGLTDQAVEGTWGWSSGQAVTYTNWPSGQPDNWWDQEDYAQMYSSGQWYDSSASSTLRGLIELDGSDSDADGVPNVLDTYTADPLNNFELRGTGPDGVFDTSDDVIYRLTLDPTYTAGTSVGLFIQQGPLPSGHYRFTANATLKDRAGNAMDGNGDGVGGDAYQRVFDVAIPAGKTIESGNNDTQGTATSLPLTEGPVGSGYLVGRGVGSMYPAGDLDWWSFTTSAGDLVSVSVDTPGSDLNPTVYLFDAAGRGLIGDDHGGPEGDAFISHYTIPTSGTYYVQVYGDTWYGGGSTTGSYELRVDVARGGTQLESDANYSNDSISGANVL
ncbi:MAG: lectin-like protein, partial [Planctomycetota bacterium]|nr:lectin-like protein [Planctomycetota bacterium]